MKPLVLGLSKNALAHLAWALMSPAPAPNEKLMAAKRRAMSTFKTLTPEEVEANRRKAYDYAF